MPMDSNIPPTTPTSSPQNFDTSVSTDKLTDTQPLMAASGTQIRENYDMIGGDPLSTASLKAQEAIERTAQNPYAQQAELAEIKRSYIKQHYEIDMP